MSDQQVVRPVTAKSVITRVVKPGSEKDFEEWLHGISQEAAKAPGHQSVTIFRPPPGGREYTMVLHFDEKKNLDLWLGGEKRREWIERSALLTEVPEQRTEVTGLEHWFSLPGKKEAGRPPKLKMASLTVLAAYPTILGLNFALRPLLRIVPQLLAPLIVTILMTLLLTYVWMPNLTRLVYRWLYPETGK